VTPNIPEAEVLTGLNIKSIQDVETAAVRLKSLGPKYVLIKGGHLGSPDVVDILFDGEKFEKIRHSRIDSTSTHGTGCTLAAAITAELAKGKTVPEAVRTAEQFVHAALVTAVPIGKGHGPLNHFRPFSSHHRLFDRLKDSCREDWDKYINHSFVTQLKEGILPIESFKYYIRQDYIFLLHFGRANALAAYKSNNIKDLIEGAKVVEDIAGVETELHVKFCEKWGISREELENTPEATSNMAYTRYVLEQGTSGDVLDLRVAMSACIIGYGEIGLNIVRERGASVETNPYKDWINVYGGEWFQSAVARAKDQLDRLAVMRGMSPERFQGLSKIFNEAVRLECRFWQMGLTLEP